MQLLEFRSTQSPTSPLPSLTVRSALMNVYSLKLSAEEIAAISRAFLHRFYVARGVSFF